MNSRVIVSKLLEVDPQFSELCQTLFGEAVDPQQVWEVLYTPDGVSKMSPTPSDVSTMGSAARKLKRTGKALGLSATGGIIANQLPQSGRKTESLRKDDSMSVVWKGEISKVDDEKRQVFGWASIVEIDGRPVIDRQGDLITPEEIEKAAYKYVLESRKGGHQHRRDGESPFHASDMIESFVLTDEKVAKMGLPDSTPRGWWVGYKVNDEDTWSLVKKGDVTGFSIHGRGRRVEI